MTKQNQTHLKANKINIDAFLKTFDSRHQYVLANIQLYNNKCSEEPYTLIDVIL